MGTLLRTIVGNTSRMQICIVLITVAIVTAQRGEGGGRRRGQRERELEIGGSASYQTRLNQMCWSWYQNNIKTECNQLEYNMPGGTIQIYNNIADPKECNKKCVDFEDERCIYWTMRKDIYRCWLFGYADEFDVPPSNQEIYVSGVRCPPE